MSTVVATSAAPEQQAPSDPMQLDEAQQHTDAMQMPTVKEKKNQEPELVVRTSSLRWSASFQSDSTKTEELADKDSTETKAQQLKAIDATSLEAQIAALVGGAPPLVLARRYKAAIDDVERRRAPCRRWRWQSFTNPARSDSLALQHWDDDPDRSTSRFSDFGMQPTSVLSYTDEEYEKYLTDPGWTKKETDHLFALCREFELRFFVIADRYEMPTPRTIEDLKDRYYSVSRALVNASYSAEDPQRTVLEAQYAYDKAREIERKQLLVRLQQRSREQIEEEIMLMRELKRRELKEERWTKDREAILRSLMSHEYPGQSNLHHQHGYAMDASMSAQNRRKKRTSMRSDDPHYAGFGHGTVFGTSTDSMRGFRRDGDDSSQSGQMSASSRQYGSSRRERIPPGSHIRTARLQTFKSNTYNRICIVLAENGIGLLPKMPTLAVCTKYDELRNAIVTMTETRKQLDRLEHEIKIAQARKKALKEDLAAGRKPGTGFGSQLIGSGLSGYGGTPSSNKRPLSSGSISRETKRSRN